MAVREAAPLSLLKSDVAEGLSFLNTGVEL
jgi:hypothetical protein